MKKTVLSALFLALLVFVSACSPADASTPIVPGASAGNPAGSSEVGVTDTASPQQYDQAGFSLTLDAPADGEVVSQPQVELKGRSNSDGVMTINADIHLLTAGQDFSILVPLEEGPNSLEIVASDYSGNEIDIILVVTYQP